MNDILTYTGEVCIKFVKNGKVMEHHSHNMGLEPLFRIIAQALAGEDVRASKPAKIDLRVSSDGGSTWRTALNSNGIATGVYYSRDNNGNWITRATVAISYQQLLSPIDISKLYRFYLCSVNEDLAYFPVNASDLDSIQQGTQALVEWSLMVSNAPNTNE